MHVLHCVIWLCLLSEKLVSGTEMVRFKYTKNTKILLTWDETWEVGSPNMMAILLPEEEKLFIKIALVGGDPSVPYRSIMMFKCNQSSASYSSMDLTYANMNVKQCTNEIPFFVSAKHGKYLLFLEKSPLNWVNAFEKKLELRVCILFPRGNLCSNSLFIWNFEPFANQLLTDEAIEFLQQMNVSSVASKTLGQINFLEPQVSMLIKRSPAFLRSHLYMGAVLSPAINGAPRCKDSQFHESFMIVNYNRFQNENNLNPLRLFYLDMDSGVLHYSEFGFRNNIGVFYSKVLKLRERYPDKKISVVFCDHYMHEVAGNRMTKQVFDLKMENLSIIPSNHSENECEIPENITSPMLITIFSGMSSTPLVCPIVCSEETETYRFTHVNADAIEIPLETSEDGMNIFISGNAIEFPDTLDARHAGQYKCEAGGKSFTFKVQVVAMPSFVFTLQGKKTSGSLPPVIYAMEGESLTYSCTSYYNNVTATAEPVFFSPQTLNENWRQLNLPEFNSLVKAYGKTPVSVQSKQNKTSTTLTISVHQVPSAKGSTNFTHRFACNVSVDSADAAKIGMPSYLVETGSNVFYIPRPTADSFDKNEHKNCFGQSCIATGAEFSVALKPELTKYLKQIGVEVVGLFKIGDYYLTDNEIINQNGVSNIIFDSATNRLFFKVEPIVEEKVLKELQKQKTLTPVFNLRFPDGSEMAGLRLNKERYDFLEGAVDHRDCRFDPNCFYSTDFDISSALQSIVMSINFKGPSTSASTTPGRTTPADEKYTKKKPIEWSIDRSGISLEMREPDQEEIE